jgi:hypothetical protein
VILALGKFAFTPATNATPMLIEASVMFSRLPPCASRNAAKPSTYNRSRGHAQIFSGRPIAKSVRVCGNHFGQSVEIIQLREPEVILENESVNQRKSSFHGNQRLLATCHPQPMVAPTTIKQLIEDQLWLPSKKGSQLNLATCDYASCVGDQAKSEDRSD